MIQSPKKLIIIDIILFVIAVLILLEVVLHGFLSSADLSVNASIPKIQNDFFISVSKIIDIIFDTLPVLILSLIISVVMWFRHSKKEAVFLASAMIVDAAAIAILKILVQRPRPLNALVTATDYAFPSGHTATAVVFFGMISYLLLRNMSPDRLNTFKPIIIGVFSLIIILIGFSRIYLNLHWLTDVIGGLAIGGVILTTSIILQQTMKSY